MIVIIHIFYLLLCFVIKQIFSLMLTHTLAHALNLFTSLSKRTKFMKARCGSLYP